MMKKIKEIMSQMTVREKVYQTVVQRSEKYIYDDESAQKQLSEKPLGGFFVGEEIIGSNAMKLATARHSRSRHNQKNQEGKLRLLIFCGMVVIGLSQKASLLEAPKVEALLYCEI